MQRHDTKNSKQIIPEKELRGHSSDYYIHVSGGDLYIPTIGLPILLQENGWTDGGNIQDADDKLGQTLRTRLKQ
jgi:hypothetical protein